MDIEKYYLKMGINIKGNGVVGRLMDMERWSIVMEIGI